MKTSGVKAWETTTAEEARRAFGRQVVQLREVRKRSSNSVAGAAGVGAAYMKRLERGQSAVPLVRALRIIRELDPEPAAAAGMLWLSVVGCGLGARERGYFLRILPILAARECEPLSGPPLLLRQNDLEELNQGLRACLAKTEALVTDATGERGAALAGGDLGRKRLISTNQLIDLFAGETSDIRRAALNRWWLELHPACRVRYGNRRLVWYLTPLGDGRPAESALQSLRASRGRARKRIAPRAWSAFLALQLDGKRLSASEAYRVLSFQARRDGLLWEPSASTMRQRMKLFFRDFPELRR